MRLFDRQHQVIAPTAILAADKPLSTLLARFLDWSAHHFSFLQKEERPWTYGMSIKIRRPFEL
jgi:hypothetical protein